ncbi:MAG: GNAT family N-acetyltransferase [Planctomycetota bacterium]
MADPEQSWEIVPLSSLHETVSFCSGEKQLDVYLRKWAVLNQQEDMGRTYVLVKPWQARVWGYYTITNSKVAKASLPPEEQFSANYPVPAILIGKLALDQAVRRKGLGKRLLMDALKRCQTIALQSAVRGVEVDAVDHVAEGFYTKYGFRRLTDKPLHLYLSMRVIRRLCL